MVKAPASHSRGRGFNPTVSICLEKVSLSLAGIANPCNVVKKIAKSIPDRSLPGSTRAALGVKAVGHSAKNGLQDPGSSAEQPARAEDCRATGRTTTPKAMENIKKQRYNEMLLCSRTIKAWIPKTDV